MQAELQADRSQLEHLSEPVHSFHSVQPAQLVFHPVRSVLAIQSAQPVVSVQSVQPVHLVQSVQSVQPVQPVKSVRPVQSALASAAFQVEVLVEQVSGQLEESAASTQVQHMESTQVSDSEATVAHS